ncbi:MAG: UDP-N-acetylmuramoyl-tripeptide--D-alanyl-D-alanine ligase [Marinilabiliaceae bacterium]
MRYSLEELYDVFLETGKVCTDTRALIPGSIYFALKGERFDGNRFAHKALDEGCRLAVVDEESLEDRPGLFRVPNVLEALQQLARYHRKNLRIPVIGITGSNGKTTTKELISLVLSKKFKVWHTPGNLNNHIGVPLTLLAMKPGTQIAVVEMGANHIGEIGALCEIARPDHGLITNVGYAHLEGFGSFEGVRQGKGELYNFLKRAGGEIFVNVDNDWLMEMVGDYPWIGYGTGDDAVVKASEVSAEPFLSFSLTTTQVKNMPVNTNLTGLYNLENVLAAASVGHYFGIEEASVCDAIEQYLPENNRSQVLNTEDNRLLLDAYNANPSSMKAALEYFRSIDHPRKVLVLGGMKEMGQQSKTEHEKLIEEIKKTDFVSCYLTGPEFEGMVPQDQRCHWYSSTAKLKDALKNDEIKDALILIKGSRANQLEELVEVL